MARGSSEGRSLESIILQALKDQFPKTDIERVVVTPDVDTDGDKIFRIIVVLKGHVAQLDRNELVGAIRNLRIRLTSEEHDEFPVLSFVAGSEAAKLKLEPA